MYSFLGHLGAWLLRKVVVATLIVAIALGAYAAWLYWQEEAGSEAKRLASLERAILERDQLLAIQNDLARRIEKMRAEVETQRARAKQAEKVIERLRELESWWERWFGNPKQQGANSDQLQKMEGLRTEASNRMTELQRLVTQTVWEKDGADIALRKANAEVERLEASQSKAQFLVREAWLKTRWLVGLALAGFFLGPTLWSVALYYGFAPFVRRGRSIRLGPDPAAWPVVHASAVSAELALRAGEALWIKERFLQSSDEGVAKRTRFVLDWRIPFTSVACGLIELVELRHARADGDSRVILSSSDDPHLELAVIELAENASVILRPSFLAGVIQRDERRLEIRRHWRVLRWQAWVTGQFRFFEFVGPCRLIVAGSRGVRAEKLEPRDGVSSPARRTNQDATIGFTPNLCYCPVRAETFWSYYRGMNALFDDLFVGAGMFITQETAAEGAAAKSRRFWSSIWSGVLKVFGL